MSKPAMSIPAMSEPATEIVELHRFPEATALPLILYRGAIAEEGQSAAKAFEQLFARNDWPGAWRNGIYPYHHFHATAHEVLGIAAGHAAVRFGGPEGSVVEVRAGDVKLVRVEFLRRYVGNGEDEASNKKKKNKAWERAIKDATQTYHLLGTLEVEGVQLVWLAKSDEQPR